MTRCWIARSRTSRWSTCRPRCGCPVHKSAFRVTHRFTRSLGQGDFGDLLSDFFGFDSGALIGLEYRFGMMRGLQAGILRTSDKTIQFFSQYQLKPQSETFPSAWPRWR